MKPDYYSQRRERLRKLLRRRRLPSAMLVSDVDNVTYLTGFTGDSSTLLLTESDEVLISDSRFTIQIEEECPRLHFEIRTSKHSVDEFLSNIVKKAKQKSLVVEGDHLTKARFDQIEKQCLGVELVSSSGLVRELRAIKDKQEIEKIKHAVHVAERAFAVVSAQLTCDQTEAQVAHLLEQQIRRFGGKCCSFDPIVGVGPRAALPHAVVTDNQIGAHPFVLIDWGARINGYVSDLTRVLITGKISPKIQRIYEVTLKAQMSAISKIRPGAKLKNVDAAARKVIDQEGFGKNFGHGLGHGIGLQVHEQPYLNQISSGELKPGMVVTVEPGIYLPNWGGVRIEDDVLVTRDGHQVLSSVPKSFDESVVVID